GGAGQFGPGRGVAADVDTLDGLGVAASVGDVGGGAVRVDGAAAGTPAFGAGVDVDVPPGDVGEQPAPAGAAGNGFAGQGGAAAGPAGQRDDRTGEAAGGDGAGRRGGGGHDTRSAVAWIAALRRASAAAARGRTRSSVWPVA